jgi:hypothetical protein
LRFFLFPEKKRLYLIPRMGGNGRLWGARGIGGGPGDKALLIKLLHFGFGNSTGFWKTIHKKGPLSASKKHNDPVTA